MKLYMFFFLLLLSGLLVAQNTYIVNQDGTGDFTLIQAAINFSTHGDTIIVHPGRYFENIDFDNKNIYLTSLFKYTNNRDDIDNTIIDGNQESTVVFFRDNQTRDTVLNGFTIENGIGLKHIDSAGQIVIGYIRAGGGIHIGEPMVFTNKLSAPTIINNVIQNNYAEGGAGGILIHSQAVPFFSGNIIRNNSTVAYGGGVSHVLNSTVEYDEENKNSIYNNMAARGHDIYIAERTVDFSINLDKSTVTNVHYNHIYAPDDLDFSANSTHIESFINHDLYVCTTGDDFNNTGISPDSPFKTVSHAMYYIESDPINPKTIYVAPGVYGVPFNSEIFPLQMKSFVHLKGAGAGQTIFDGEDSRGHIRSHRYSENFKISGITFQNIYKPYYVLFGITWPMYLQSFKSVEIFDCEFRDNNQGIESDIGFSYAGNSSGEAFGHDDSAIFRNLTFENNEYFKIRTHIKSPVFENIKISYNSPYYDSGIMGVYSSPPITTRDAIYYRQYHTYSNILINNNEYFTDWPQGKPWSTAFSFGESNFEVLINNATVVYNHLIQWRPSGPLVITGNENVVKIYNSIFYGNTPFNDIWLERDPYNYYGFSGPNHLYVNNTLLQGGQASIKSMGANEHLNIIHWGNGNLDIDPLFEYIEGNFPYQLSANSTLIGAGTTDIDWEGYVFPEFDIMGNPRITNGRIDIGAYQFHGIYADFSAEPTTGQIPLTVQFSCQSTGSIFAWAWDFTGDGIMDSTEQNPVFTYHVAGIYNVTLTINNGESSITKPNFIDVTVDNIDISLVPLTTQLKGNYPNPFNPETTIYFDLANDSVVSIEIFNIRGQRVRILTNNHFYAGKHSVVWNGTDDNGKTVSSGIYFQKMVTEDYFATRRMVLIK